MMNFGETNLFALASKRLQWLSDRQAVISENVANADTAGYRTRDVESFESYLNNTRDETLARAEIVESQSNWGADFSGNNVALEEQLMHASSNAGQYKMATNLYRKAHELLISVASSR
jgi:flagellar basal-body rod protein FlgB